MKPFFRSPCPSASCLGGLLTVVLGVLMTAQSSLAAVDDGLTRVVWSMYYGVADTQINDPGWLAADDDGDGLSNGSELAAGTNPFKATSNVATGIAVVDNGAVSISVPTVFGKLYRLQTTTSLADPAAWTDVSPIVQVSGDGTVKNLSASGGVLALFRVVITDQDSDGDGVSDWAEKITGFDPYNTHTKGAALDDRAALTAGLASENVVTVTANKANATQPLNAFTAATDTGSLTITRGGTLHFSTVKVPLTWNGTAVSGTDYALLPSSVTFLPKVGSVTLTVVPLANPARRTAATLTVNAVAGGGYALGAPRAASVAIAPASNTDGTGLTGYYWNSTSALIGKGYSATLFSGNPTMTRLDAGLNFAWAGASPGTGAGGTAVTGTYFVARWVGQVQPQYSETYYFDTLTDDGVKLWVNGQLLIDGWSYQAADRIASIRLQAGVLYDLKMEYYQATGGSQAKLYWFSESQPKVIIPSNRLYPDTTVVAPPGISSATQVVGFVGQPFSFTVTASAPGGAAPTFALGANSGPLPPGLTLNAATGVISGTPTQAGEYQIALTATNAAGVGGGVLSLRILNVGNGVTRELWNGVGGDTLADVPFSTAPSAIDNTLVALEDNTSHPDRTGERLRGYFTAPATGNYYFWLAASNTAELWISNDADSINKTRRASVVAPGVTSRTWKDAGQPSQRSPWLALQAGQRYYYEVLHNTGTSGGAEGNASIRGGRTRNAAAAGLANNLAVGYAFDATGVGTAPATGTDAVVPGFALSKYDYPQATTAEDVLYGTNLSPQGSATSTATGSANLRIVPGSTRAILHFNYSGLTSPRTAYHVHLQDASGSGPIVYDLDDIDKFHPELITADGGYIWDIVGVGTLSQAQIVAGIQAGNAYFNVHTVNYPNGEIRGNLGLILGSQTPPALVADPGYSNDSGTDAGAARFLNQAAFGASPDDLTAVKSGGYEAWMDGQFSLPATSLYADVMSHLSLNPGSVMPPTIFDNAWWRSAITAPDQLRQRMAFALSEILVISDTNSNLGNNADALASYYDVLMSGAFGNFREVLESITLHPAMGNFLNMQGNKKGSITAGSHPNENYGREIMQLFSLGLNRLWPDGSVVLDSQGSVVPTYGQDEITGMALVFTGWNWNQALQANGRLPTGFGPSTNWTKPMTLVPLQHELGPKQVLDNVVLPPAQGYVVVGTPAAGTEANPDNVAFDNYGLNDLEKAVDNVFNHPNVGPYICRQLIQRFVQSNPSPEYLHRVVRRFDDDGSPQHVRGNLRAVLKAILLDGEARDVSRALASATAGKQREPLLRIAGPARTFPYAGNSGTYSQNGALAMTITTATPNRLSAGDGVALDFTGNYNGGVAPVNNPTSGNYAVLSSPAPTANTFAVNATSLSSIAYTQAAGTNTVVVTASGLAVGNRVFLQFLTGGAPSGVYTVGSLPDTTHFTVTTTETAPTVARTGTLLLPKASGFYTAVKNSTTVTAIPTANVNVQVGDRLQMIVPTGVGAILSTQEIEVIGVTDEGHFTFTVATAPTAGDNGRAVTFYPLLAPPLTRSGKVSIPAGRFDMGRTNGSLTQTPLAAPSVFNFFYPDYMYPGDLAANNVTTPEFQITTDSNIVTLTNTVNSTILSSGNTAGLSSFNGGSLLMDLSTLMGSPYVTASTTGTTTTTTVNATLLIGKLNDLFTGGTLTQATKDTIANFINNTTYFPPTSATSGRDKVRAVAQLILASPEYAVQK